MGPLAAEHEAGAVQEHCWEAGMACEAAEDRDWRQMQVESVCHAKSRGM